MKLSAQNSFFKQARIIVLTAVIFFIVTMPFREVFSVMVVTEMRPASALPPVFGLMYGIPGAIGCALGNLVADIRSGYAPTICAWGFGAQLLFGLIPLVLWRGMQRLAKEKPRKLRLDTVRNILRFIVVITLNSLLMSFMLGLIFKAHGTSLLLSATTLLTLFNNFVFGIALGIPLVIFITQMRLRASGERASLNERLVLFFFLLCCVAIAIVGFVAYDQVTQKPVDQLEIWSEVYFYMFVSLVVLIAITVFILRNVERNVAVPIEEIAAVARGYVGAGALRLPDSEGALARLDTQDTLARLDSQEARASLEAFTHIGNEAGTMAEAFQTMLLELDTYIANLESVTAEKERIGAELDVAARIQASMLPCVFPAFPERTEFDIYATMQPAKEVGGDFYDFFLIDEKTLCVVMADVSGKGVPAALFMVIAKTLIKNNAQRGLEPSEVFEIVNNLLCENNEASMFVTAFMGYLDLESGRFTFVNAGHNPPLLARESGWEWLKGKKSFMLAGMEGTRYQANELFLRPGDELFLYTDGVTEAMNNEGALFSDARLFEEVSGRRGCDLERLLSSVKERVDDFADGAEVADDITMLALRYLSP